MADARHKLGSSFVFGLSQFGGGTYTKRLKDWVDGEILYELDLDAEFDNIVENLTTGGLTKEGLLQLEDSHESISVTKAACPKNVKEAYDLANSKTAYPDTGEQAFLDADRTKLNGIATDADVTGSNAPQAHKISHQYAGGDEMNVGGLSGLLANDQHVLDSEVQAISINNLIEDVTPQLGGNLDMNGKLIGGNSEAQLDDAVAKKHAQLHSVASHSDTLATGAQLNILVGGGETSLHSHAGGGAGDVLGPATHAANYVPQWNGTPNSKTLVAGFAITVAGKALLDDANAVAQRTTLGLGSAATRNAEDAMTNGSNLPDGAAIKAYGDTNWGGGGGSEKTLHFSDYYNAGSSAQTATDLNTALTAAAGKILVIDGGNSTIYTFKGVVNVPANTTVEGDGAWLKWDMDSQCGISLNGSGNTTLRHLFLNMSNPTHYTTANTTSYGIFVQGPHCRIFDCHMKGSATHAHVAIKAIYLGDYSDNSYLEIKDNYFKQTYWTIARFNSTWNGGGAHPSPMGKISYAKITGNYFINVLADGIEINLGEDDVGVDISFNTMNGVHRQDAGPNGLAIGVAGWDNDDAGAPPENEVQRHFKIEGNIIRNADYVGIHVEQCHNFIINDNFVYNAGSTGLEGGIVVWGGSYEFEITDNHVKECEYGIRVSPNWAGDSWNYGINDNTVIDCGSYGIHAESTTANNLSAIKGNQISDSGGDGIYIATGASDWNITNNTVRHAGAYSFDINYENASNTMVLVGNSSTNPVTGSLTKSNYGSATIRELGNSWNAV